MAPGLPRVVNTIRDAATKDLWRAIEDVAVPVTLQKGGALFREGDDGESLYIIRSGEIEISVLSESGRKLALNMLAVLSMRLRQFTVQIENLSLKEVQEGRRQFKNAAAPGEW